MIVGNSLKINTFDIFMNTLQTNVSSLSGTGSFNFNVNNVGTAPLTLGQITCSNATITTAGAMNVTGTINTAAVNLGLIAGGAITVSNDIGSLTGTTSIQSGGAITNTKGSGMIHGQSLTILAGAGGIGSSMAALRIDTESLTVASTGIINLSNNPAGADLLFVNSLALPASSFQLVSGTGGITVNNISTSNGSINVVASSGTLQVGVNAVTGLLNATNGNITLQNLDTVAGTIMVGGDADLHASATAAGLGQVTIVVGAIPNTKQLTAVTSIANGLITTSGGGQVFVGTNAVNLAGSDYLNAFGRNIILDSGVVAGAVSIGLSAILTADPPPGSALVSLVPATRTFQGGTIQVSPAVSPTVSSGGVVSAPGIIQIGTTLPASMPTSMPTIMTVAANSLLPMATIIPSSMIVQAAATANSTADLSTSGNIPETAASKVGTLRDFGSGSTGELEFAMAQKSKERHGPARTGLDRGGLLLAAEKDTRINTPFGEVKVGSRAVVLIIATGNALSVFDLDDRHKDSVKVQVGGDEISLSPGRHVTITAPGAKSFADVNPAYFVGHRQIIAQIFKPGTTAFHSEFDLPSVLTGLQSMNEKSYRTLEQDKKVSQHMLKTAAILSQISQSAEPFQLALPVEVTAMNK